MCVCVCVCVCVCLDPWMLCIFLLWDVFESLTCWLDLCLSSLLVAFISMCFSFLWKHLFFKLDSFSTDLHISSPFSSWLDRSYRILNPSSLLDYVSIAFRSIEKLSVRPIVSWQILDPSRCFCCRQILENTLTDSFLLRIRARQILRSIEILLLSIAISSFSFLSCISFI